MAVTPTSNNPAPRRWRWLAALAILGNIALTYYSRLRPINGQSMGYVSAKYPTLLTPAGYAFSIWGLIFLTLALYAGWQLRPAQRANPLPDAVARPLVVANVATAAWVVAFAYERLGLCALLMVVILGALALTYGRARYLVLAGAAPAWVSLPFGLYLGWISVATILSFTIELRSLGWQPATNVSLLLTLGLLLLIVGLGMLLSRAFQDVTGALVLAWALVAVWVAQRPVYPELGWLALGAAAVVAAGSLSLVGRRSTGAVQV